LPHTEDGSALAINRFLTDLEIFSQTFADMSNIAFDKLYLKSALGDVYAEVCFIALLPFIPAADGLTVSSLCTLVMPPSRPPSALLSSK
jgi:hypothetical protein